MKRIFVTVRILPLLFPGFLEGGQFRRAEGKGI